MKIFYLQVYYPNAYKTYGWNNGPKPGVTNSTHLPCGQQRLNYVCHGLLLPTHQLEAGTRSGATAQIHTLRHGMRYPRAP